jgi:diaminohydroxyphosphoribosylaminopyrimidine deaminase/5-amino-6-(5-phosphoribosylamino)uracil reductase
MRKASDERFLLRAAELARKGEGHTRPNPPVGAVAVKGGKIIGEGWHRRCGGDHAEVAAIKDARRRGNDPAGCELFVTLEPCSRPGRVGACTDAIAAAGIKRVVYACGDPNPVNRGRAARILRKAGIECVKVPLPEASEILRPFAKHVTTGLPFVTVKIAMSLDGRICDVSGDAKWISGAKTRRLTGGLRERVDAIMVGAETVRRDDPSLLSHGARNDDLIRVVVSASGNLPESAQVFTDGKNPTLVFDASGGLEDMLRQLADQGVMWVLCEGGLKLARALADAGLVDEWITVLAPSVIGGLPVGGRRRFKADGEVVRCDGDLVAAYRAVRGDRG